LCVRLFLLLGLSAIHETHRDLIGRVLGRRGIETGVGWPFTASAGQATQLVAADSSAAEQRQICSSDRQAPTACTYTDLGRAQLTFESTAG
jgi:hypothetical protein